MHVTHTLPSHWASYLINSDPSGLCSEDKDLIDAFLKVKNLPRPVVCGKPYIFKWNRVADYIFDVEPKYEIKVTGKGSVDAIAFALHHIANSMVANQKYNLVAEFNASEWNDTLVTEFKLMDL